MFKLLIPIIKSVKSADRNVLIVEGIASDPTIDRDEERFSEEAVKKMAESVNTKQIPIRVEHENKFFTNVGVWKTAEMVGDKLRVTGEIDLDMSLGKDIQVVLNKGLGIALSVGGRVLDASIEYAQDLGKSIRVYKDMILDEISVVLNASNKSATLAIAKSYDPDKRQETAEAQVLAETTKQLIEKTENEVDIRKSILPFLIVRNKNIKAEKATMEELMSVMSGVFERGVTKFWDDEVCSEYCCEEKHELTQEDIDLICLIVRIMQDIDVSEVVKPIALEDWDFVGKLPEESFVTSLDGKWFPHHNADFTINMEWLTYWLAHLVSGAETWLSPEQYALALDHLYHHFKYITMDKKIKADVSKSEATKAEMTGAETGELFTKEVVSLMQSSYEFYVNKSGERPQVDGNDLSNTEVKRLAEAYRTYTTRKRAQETEGAKLLKQLCPDSQPEQVTKDEILSTNETIMKAKAKPAMDAKATAKKPVMDEKMTKTEEVKEEIAVTKEGEEAQVENKEPEKAKDGSEEDAEKAEKSEADASIKKEADTEDAPADGTESEKPSLEESTETKKSEDEDEDAESEDTEEVEEDGVEKAVKEQVTKAIEAIKIELAKTVAEQIAEVVKQATESATKIIEGKMADLTKQFQPKIDSLNKDFTDLRASVSQSAETLTKSTKEETDRFAKVEGSLEKITNTIEVFGKSVLGRKSVASAEIRKAFVQDIVAKGDSKDLTVGQQIDSLVAKFVDEDKMLWRDAYSKAKKQVYAIEE